MRIVKFKKLDPRAVIPHYMTPRSVGMDLCVIIDSSRPLMIDPGKVILLNTGLAMEMDENMEAQIRPRSGLSLRYPNYIANSPGTIDSDYRGEIKIPFVNNTKTIAIIGHEERIAQMIFSNVIRVDVQETDKLTDTTRSSGGFGHTGL
jgi:dUTP pyrophosphatase